jgi:hypothetical protein
MQVKMLVRVDVIEREAGRAERLELGADLRPHLSAHMGQKEHRGAGERHIRPKPAARVDEVRDGGGRRHRLGVDQRQMQPDSEPRQAARQLHGFGRRRRSDHQARRRQDPFDMRALDRLIDLVGETEVVGRDDQIFQCAVSCRSRRKWKNSTPSRKRRFMTSGLFTISPRIEAILPGRK